MMFHLLQLSGPLDQEFASALGKAVPTLGWKPEMKCAGLFRTGLRAEPLTDPPLSTRCFRLQRGFHRPVLRSLYPLGRVLTSLLQQESAKGEVSALICTAPFYAPVAEQWPGPVIYWLIDLMAAYEGANPRQIRALDRRMCRTALLVCPNSRRIAAYLMQEAGCPEDKILILPNATRQANLYSTPPEGPAELPADIQDLPRPVVGVLGNLASNMDWLLLEDVVARTADFSWAFVGPTDMRIRDARQSSARAHLLAHGGRVRFLGRKPYGLLQQYARAFDVAVLPYMKREPTYSGSSTRFYDHLAACRPMLATRAFEELLHNEPLLSLVDNASELVRRLGQLREQSFGDEYECLRWRTSLACTWEHRAATLLQALAQRGYATALVSVLPPERMPSHNGLQNALCL